MARVPFYCLLITFCFLLSCNKSFCQNNKITDSLEYILQTQIEKKSIKCLETYDKLFREYQNLGNQEQSKIYAYSLLKEAKEYESKRYILKGMLNEAWTLLNAETAELAHMKVEDILQEAIKIKDKLIEAECYYFLGHYTRYFKHQFDCYYFTRAKELFDELKSERSIYVWSYLLICRKLKKEANFSEKSLTELNKAAENSNSPFLKYRALDVLLYSQFSLNQYDKMHQTATEGLKIALEYNYTGQELVRIYSMFSQISFKSNNEEEGLKFARLAYEAGMSSSDVRAKTKGIVRLASLYSRYVPEKYDEAEELFLESIDLAKKNKMYVRYAYATSNYGDLLKRKKDIEGAIKKYIECIEFIDTSTYKNSNLEAQAKANLFKLLEESNDNEKLKSLEKYFLEKSTDSLNLKPKELIYEIRKIIALKTNDYEKAFEWQKLEHEIKSELQQKIYDSDSKQSYLKSQLEIERKINSKNKELLRRKNTNNNLLLISSILLLVLFLFQLLRIRTKKSFNNKILQKNQEISSAMDKIEELNAILKEKNETLKQKNEIKNKELLDFAMFKATHDNQMRKIKQDVTSLTKKNSIDIVDLKLIESKLDSLLSNEEEHWISFRQKIEDAFPNFFTNLSLKHPELTQRDQFHCGFVLIGMSVKGAAKASFVTIATVNSTRYRIKKKLGLSKTDSLKDYLANISDEMNGLTQYEK